MRRMLASLALATAWAPSAAPAQSTHESPPTTITLRPADAPRPALKYRLVPERSEMVPGNAAIFYHRAILLASTKRAQLDADREAKGPAEGRPAPVNDRVSGWVAGPIGEVPVEEARAVLGSFQSSLNEVEQGATRASCDWEFDRRPEALYLLLPEIQEMRPIARLVALRARLAILEGRADEAMHWAQVGLVMGRNVARGPILIQALVGVAIDNQMIRCLEDLIQVPGAPNLYWALADRPRPFIDMREPMDGERRLLEKEIPDLEDLGRGPWGLDRARKFADVLQRKLYSFDNGYAGGSTAQRFGVAAMTAKIYPKARRALIAQGLPEAEVEAMPVVQVASLYCYQEYRRLLDESYKWLNLPQWQSAGRVDALHWDTVEEKRANPLLAMFRSLTPAVEASRNAAFRIDRQLDALQCIEAIRLHAAASGGKLPASLDSITDAPTPLDPSMGRPFAYHVEGDSATLSAPLPPGSPNHPTFLIRYALKPAR